MLKKTVLSTIALLFALAFGASLRAQGWDYLGDAHVDGGQDHDSIHVGKHDGRFRAIQLRVNGGEVFFEHVYDYYPNGRLRRVKATNPDGVETVREYRQTDRVGFFW